MAWSKSKKKPAKKRKFSAEHRARMSAAQKRSWKDPEVRRSRVEPRVGQKRSAETKKKMSESRRKRRGGHTDPKLIAKMNEARRGSHNTPEQNKKISEAKKKWHEDHPELSRKLIDKATRANRYFDNKLELRMAAILDDLGIEYEKQHRARSLPGGHGKHKWDFRVRGERVLIEVDGCFWHGCGRHASAARRKDLKERAMAQLARDRCARSAGWIVLRFWEHDLRDDLTAVVMTVIGATRRRRDPAVA